MKVATNARRSEFNASSGCVFIVTLQKPQPAHDFQYSGTVIAVPPGLVWVEWIDGDVKCLKKKLKQETHLGRVGSVPVCSINVIR